MSDTPRIIIWAAVSSKPQASEDKSSLQVQERDGREYDHAKESKCDHDFGLTSRATVS